MKKEEKEQKDLSIVKERMLRERCIQGEQLESIRVISNYFTSLNQKGIVSVAITSHCSNQGKTQIIKEVGVELAKSGIHTLIIDANYFAPDITITCHSEDKEGLLNILEEMTEALEAGFENKVDCMKYICDTNFTDLSILPLGFQNKTSVEDFFISDSFGRTLSKIKEKYDIVLVEIPSFEHLSYVQSFTKYLDGAVLILRAGELKVSQAEEVKEKINTLSDKMLCTILCNQNKKNRKKQMNDMKIRRARSQRYPGSEAESAVAATVESRKAK